MMLVTVWVFIGIEGAAVYSKRAANRRDVGRATVLGFVGVLALLLLGMRLGVMLRSGEVNAPALEVLRPALLAKLLLLPAVMWALAAITAQPALVRDVLVLQAAAPTAISVLLIAEASSRDVSEAAGLVFASTLLALFSVPLWWLLLQALG